MAASKQRGFTLMEVLVAGIILFLVITTVTLIYRGAVLSSTKAESAVIINGSLPAIINLVQAQIQSDMQAEKTQISGEDSFGKVNYQWRARLLSAKGALPRYVPGGSPVEQPKRYKLWGVELQIHYQGSTREFSYRDYSFQALQ